MYNYKFQYTVKTTDYQVSEGWLNKRPMDHIADPSLDHITDPSLDHIADPSHLCCSAVVIFKDFFFLRTRSHQSLIHKL